MMNEILILSRALLATQVFPLAITFDVILCNIITCIGEVLLGKVKVVYPEKIVNSIVSHMIGIGRKGYLQNQKVQKKTIQFLENCKSISIDSDQLKANLACLGVVLVQGFVADADEFFEEGCQNEFFLEKMQNFQVIQKAINQDWICSQLEYLNTDVITSAQVLFQVLIKISNTEKIDYIRAPTHKKVFLKIFEIAFLLLSNAYLFTHLAFPVFPNQQNQQEEPLSMIYNLFDCFFRAVTELSNIFALEKNFGSGFTDCLALIPAILNNKMKEVQSMRREITMQMSFLGYELLENTPIHLINEFNAKLLRIIVATVVRLANEEQEKYSKSRQYKELRLFTSLVVTKINSTGKRKGEKVKEIFEEINFDVVRFLNRNKSCQ